MKTRYLAHDGNSFLGTPNSSQLDKLTNKSANLIPFSSGVIILTNGSYTVPKVFDSVEEAKNWPGLSGKTKPHEFFVFKNGEQLIEDVNEADLVPMDERGYFFGGGVMLYYHPKDGRPQILSEISEKEIYLSSFDDGYIEKTRPTKGRVFMRECPHYPIRAREDMKIFA